MWRIIPTVWTYADMVFCRLNRRFFGRMPCKCKKTQLLADAILSALESFEGLPNRRARRQRGEYVYSLKLLISLVDRVPFSSRGRGYPPSHFWRDWYRSPSG